MTGATHGFGLEAARHLAASADTLVLMVRTPERGTSLAKKLAGEHPDLKVDLIPGDLSNPESAQSFVETVKARYPRIDALVNNAGAVFLSKQVDAEGRSLNRRVNFLAPAQICLRLHPVLPPGAVVVNTSSMGEAKGEFAVAALEAGSLDQADYSQAKRAFLMFTLAMARRWAADSIQVRAFHPKMVVPDNQVPAWVLKLLRATVFQSTQAVGASLAAVIMNPGTALYQTVGQKSAMPSRGARVEADQDRVFAYVDSLTI
jgi:NAD(P)-dependent dehydrogenase (short-subunit alcohol dehydrogenase family)